MESVNFGQRAPCSILITVRYKGPKGKAWEAVKAYTRRVSKDCYTCPKKSMPDINAGHYMPVAIVGSNNALSWDHRFIHSQCSRCNGPGQGMQESYRRHLVKDYGEEIVSEFDKKVYSKMVLPIKDWKAIKDFFDNL